MRRPLLRSPFSLATIPALAVSFAVAACSSEAPMGTAATSVGKEESAIIHGKNSDSSQDAVILLVYPVGNAAYECSGSLIAPNLIVTARHCVSDTADQGFSCDPNGNGSSGADTKADFTASNMYIVTGNTRPLDPTQPGSFAALGKTILHDDATNLCNHDIGFVVLDREIPNAKIYPVRVDTPAVKAETFTAIGWGVTTSTTEPTTRQQRTDVPIALVGPGVEPNSGVPVPSREFLIGEAICQGDSGGPALTQDTGAIIGIVSRGGNGTTAPQNDPSAGCTNGVNLYTMTSGYKDLFTQAYAAAGQEPWWEGQPDPRLAKFGGTCASNDACRSNLCLTDGKGTFTTCTQTCDKTTACPGGYACANTDATGAGTCLPATTTTTKSCSCGIANVDAPRAAGWTALGGVAVLAARRRRRRAAKPSGIA